jgi:hypothetical protein
VDFNWTSYERGVDYELDLIPDGLPEGRRFFLRTLPGGPTFNRGDRITIAPFQRGQPRSIAWTLIVDGSVRASARGLEAEVTLQD